jgi:hypothetical protein
MISTQAVTTRGSLAAPPGAGLLSLMRLAGLVG